MYDKFLTQSAIQRLGASWFHEAGRTGCGSARTRRSARSAKFWDNVSLLTKSSDARP
jgi:hypothetical protein